MSEHVVGSQAGKTAKKNTKLVAEPDIDSYEIDEDAVLHAMEASIAQDTEDGPKHITVVVPQRPAMKVVFKIDLEYDLFNTWVRRATDKKTSEVNYMKLALPVLSHLCTGIKFNGRDVTKDGEPVTLAHPRLHQMLKVPAGSTGQAIKKMWVLEGHAIQAMRVVLGECGYTVDGDVVESEEEDNPLDA